MSMDEFFIGVKNLLIDRSKEGPEWTESDISKISNTQIEEWFRTHHKDHSLRLSKDIF